MEASTKSLVSHSLHVMMVFFAQEFMVQLLFRELDAPASVGTNFSKDGGVVLHCVSDL